MKPKVQLFLDEIDAHGPETEFIESLNDHTAPFTMDSRGYVRADGQMTACYQHGKLVGMTTRFRDEFNRTILVCVDLRDS